MKTKFNCPKCGRENTAHNIFKKTTNAITYRTQKCGCGAENKLKFGGGGKANNYMSTFIGIEASIFRPKAKAVIAMLVGMLFLSSCSAPEIVQPEPEKCIATITSIEPNPNQAGEYVVSIMIESGDPCVQVCRPWGCTDVDQDYYGCIKIRAQANEAITIVFSGGECELKVNP